MSVADGREYLNRCGKAAGHEADLLAEVQRLREEADRRVEEERRKLQHYGRHLNICGLPDGGPCTCGFVDVLLERARGLAPEREKA